MFCRRCETKTGLRFVCDSPVFCAAFFKQKVCLKQSFYPLRQITVYKQIVAETSGKTEAVENFVQTEVRMPVVKDRKL